MNGGKERIGNKVLNEFSSVIKGRWTQSSMNKLINIQRTVRIQQILKVCRYVYVTNSELKTSNIPREIEKC